MWKPLALLGIVMAAALGGAAWYVLGRQDLSDCGVSTVAGAIGGPFELVSETGETVTDREVIDRPALVYFGYTFCPDVCPLDAARNAAAVDLLAERGLEVRPVFITVDPARDTAEILAEFTDYMHPAMLGLTGSEAQVKAAAQAYKVFYSVPQDAGEDYLVSHSTFTYLMLPKTGFAEFFKNDAPPEEVAERTACFLGAG